MDIQNVNTSNYTDKDWLSEMIPYLKDVIGMNEQQVNNEIETRFPDLWEAHKHTNRELF